jgi:uncharacterized membrane protein YphA (DoxX/SURF4 family)
MAYWLFFLRLVLGGIFVVSGFAKISYPGSNALDPQIAETFSVFPFIPLDLIHLYVEVLPWIELFLALGLVLGIFLHFFSAASILVIASFLFANGLFAYYGFSSHCSNCFGQLLELKLPQAIGIDLLMLGIAVWLFLSGDIGISVDHWLRKSHMSKKNIDVEI